MGPRQVCIAHLCTFTPYRHTPGVGKTGYYCVVREGKVVTLHTWHSPQKVFLATQVWSPLNYPQLPPPHCSPDLLCTLKIHFWKIHRQTVNIKYTLIWKTKLLSPEESLCISPFTFLHVASHHDGVSVDGVDGVDTVGYGVVEPAHVLRTTDLLCFVITDVPTHQTEHKIPIN